MTLSSFHPGEAVHCYISDITSSSGAIVEPDPIIFTRWNPAGTASVATTSAGITTGGSSGLFYSEVIPTTSEVGAWHYRWSSTGAHRITQWGAFRVIDPPRST